MEGAFARHLMRMLFLALPLLAACSGSTPEQTAPLGFALLDKNPDSTSSGELVSPQDHLGHVTAWYFGSST